MIIIQNNLTIPEPFLRNGLEKQKYDWKVPLRARSNWSKAQVIHRKRSTENMTRMGSENKYFMSIFRA